MVLVQCCTIEKHYRSFCGIVDCVDRRRSTVLRVHESDKTNSTLGAYSSTVTVIIFACPVDHF